jgi:hypothetical protein
MNRAPKPAITLLAVLLASCTLASCSSDDESAKAKKPEHVWKEQTEAIDKARDVGRQLGDAAAKQRKAVE